MTPSSMPATTLSPAEHSYSIRSANISWVLELLREGDPEQAYYALVDSVCAQLRTEGLPDNHLVTIALRQAAHG